MRTPTLASAALAVALLSPPAVAADLPRLDMVFYQPDFDEGFGNPVRRQVDLDRAAEAGVQHVIVQYLAHGQDSLIEGPTGVGDPIRGLLDEAHARGMKVWLGTLEEPRMWKRKQVPLRLWEDIANRGVEVARRAAERYGAHPAFAGWYWTPEVVWWTSPSPRRLEKLSLVTQQAVAQLRQLDPGKPVAIVFGPGGRGEGNLLGLSWCRYIEAVDPDVVIVMDGVGSAHLDVLLAPALYGLAYRCADRAGAEVWADVELFGPDLQMRPTFSRLDAQYEAAREGAPVVGVFDLPHWLALGTTARRWLDGQRPTGRRVGLRIQTREPDRDWLEGQPVRRGSLTLEVSEKPDPIQRVEVVTRGLHPRTVSLSARGATGTWQEWGMLEARHGPARDEWTWTWETPGSAPLATDLRVFMIGRRRGIRVVDVRVFEPE